jgi:DNA-binding ferritin-like protein
MNYYDNFYEGLNDTRNLLYRQIDTVSTLNKLLSTLYSEIQNLKNYKINIKGENIFNTKQYLNEIINPLETYYDKIQELIKVKNGFPIFQLGDIESISLIKTLASMDYKTSTVLSNILNEFKIIKNLINETIATAQKENDYKSINILSDLLYEINKVLLNHEL